MKHRIGILIGIVALLVGAVVFVAAQGGQGAGQRQGHEGMPPPPPPGPPGMPFHVPPIEHLTKAFGLSEAQAAELKPFLESESATLDGIEKRLGDTHQQMMETTKDGHFDEAQLRALAGLHAQAMVDMIVEQERVKSKIYSVLTTEQRAKMQQMHHEGGPHPGMHGGPGMPPPPPPRPDN